MLSALLKGVATENNNALFRTKKLEMCVKTKVFVM